MTVSTGVNGGRHQLDLLSAQPFIERREWTYDILSLLAQPFSDAKGSIRVGWV